MTPAYTERLLLMKQPSFNLSPLVLAILDLSEPARSTKFNLEPLFTLTPLFLSPVITKFYINTVCDLEDS